MKITDASALSRASARFGCPRGARCRVIVRGRMYAHVYMRAQDAPDLWRGWREVFAPEFSGFFARARIASFGSSCAAGWFNLGMGCGCVDASVCVRG